MASATSLVLHCNKLEDVFVFQEQVCNSGIGNASGMEIVLDEQAGLHVAGNVGH